MSISLLYDENVPLTTKINWLGQSFIGLNFIFLEIAIKLFADGNKMNAKKAGT